MIGDGGYSPYHDVSDNTRCTCGHRFDEHTRGICTEPDRSRPYIGTIYAHDLCPCNSFEPDEDAA